MKRSMPKYNDYIQPVTLPEGFAERLIPLTESLIEDVIWQYQGHHVQHRGVVSSLMWQKLKQKQQLTCYKQQQTDKDASPVVLTIGQMPGAVEDVMFGLVNTTQQDMAMQSSYTDNDLVDSRVLASIVAPTPVDPFRTISIKWALRNHQRHGVYRLRDYVYVESTGLTSTQEGQRIGYHLVHSISLPSIPELPQELKIIRAHASSCNLYRQHRQNNMDCYLKGSADLQGGVRDKAVVSVVSEMLLNSSSEAIRCALMKKLSFALRNASSSSASSCSSTSSKLQSPRGSDDKKKKKKSECGVCQRNVRSFLASKSQCEVCHAVVCSRCTVVKKVVMHDRRKDVMTPRRADFCKACVMNTNTTSALWVASKEVQSRSSSYHSKFSSLSSSRSANNSNSSWCSSSRTQPMSTTSDCPSDDVLHMSTGTVHEDDAAHDLDEEEECPIIGMPTENEDELDLLLTESDYNNQN